MVTVKTSEWAVRNHRHKMQGLFFHGHHHIIIRKIRLRQASLGFSVRICLLPTFRSQDDTFSSSETDHPILLVKLSARDGSLTQGSTPRILGEKLSGSQHLGILKVCINWNVLMLITVPRSLIGRGNHYSILPTT